MTNRPPLASSRQKPSSHQSIDPPLPMTSRMGASSGSPNASAHSSTPFASIIRSATEGIIEDDVSRDAEEVPLTGGISTPGVVRVGDTVRRPVKEDAGYVHALLEHFEATGFDGTPRFLGIDSKHRAVFTYIEGFAPPHDGFELSEERVAAGARP